MKAVILFGAAMVAQTARAQSDPFCPVRNARTDAAFAVVRVRALTTTENAFSGRGDHCDAQKVAATVTGAIKGPLRPGEAVAFELSQGACGVPDSVNDDFVEPGAELVVALRRTAAGEIYQVRAESPAVYTAKERACGR